MKRFVTLLVVVAAIIVATMSTTPIPSYAQGNTPAVTNIQVAQGHNPGEVIVSWDAVPEATHYPLAKASVTGEWIEAFLYADVNARNFTVSGGRTQYTLPDWRKGSATRSR